MATAEKSRSGAIVYGAVYMNIPQIDERDWPLKQRAQLNRQNSTTAATHHQLTARFIRNGQAHRAMRVKFPARVLNRLDPTTVRNQDGILV